ncbi:SDR family oxidoreductase [Phycicoccus sp.]|uniref:SDR family NAD(P)-dependent oxidoreductase n=1 Tax=Phycicoccus sp. TaxID=1902410 RepID=UPI002CAF58EF|nr:SDR family oxidoreductase [Phycicoccus sp.]HMM93596.1 SDR family oxidoreductase [Phycicoccus sp.]
MDLTGCLAVVTGAGAGLGEVVARAAAARGCRVLVADRDGEAAERVAAGLRTTGGRARGVACDVLLDDDLERLAAEADAEGGAALLVNNAGGWGDAPAQYPEADPDEWSAVLALNLRAPMLLLQRCLPGLRRHGGAVVNVASSGALGRAPYGSPPYGAAKAGLIRLTTSLGGPATGGVRVTCVVPGWVGLPRALEEWDALTVTERSGRPALVPPEHVAATVLDLAADDAPGGTVVELLDGTGRTVLAPAPA